MGVDRQPTDGLEMIATILGPDTVVANDSVFLQEVHYLDFVHLTIGDPVLQFVFHRGLMASLRNFIPTMTTIIQKPQEVNRSTIGQLISQPIHWVMIFYSLGDDFPQADCHTGPKNPAPDSNGGVSNGFHCLAIIKNPILAMA